MKVDLRSDLLQATDEQLLTRARAAAAQERDSTQVVLEYLLEVDRRQLFLKRGYPSLFDFCIHELHYCAGSAHLRIQSMRLLKEVGESERQALTEKISNGRLTLSQLSHLQSSSRQVPAGRVHTVQKLEILSQIEGKSTRESQKTIFSALGLKHTDQERLRVRGPDLVELTVTLPGEAVDLLEEWKSLQSHALGGGKNGEAILAALRVAVADARKKRGLSATPLAGTALDLRQSQESQKIRSPEVTGSSWDSARLLSSGDGARVMKSQESAREMTSREPARAENSGRFRLRGDGDSLHAHEPVRPLSSASKGSHPDGTSREPGSLHAHEPITGPALPQAIPQAIRRAVWARDHGRCTFSDTSTGRRCLSRKYLEIDHIQPRSHGGTNDLENLRLLCGAHHRLRHRAEIAAIESLMQ